MMRARVPVFSQPSGKRGVATIADGRITLNNPFNDAVIKTGIDVDSPKTISDKINSCRAAQREWVQVPMEKKKEIFTKFSDLLVKEKDNLAKTLSSETGKPISQARGEATATVNRIKFFLENVDSVIANSPRKTGEKLKEEVRHEPLGVIANISAWNYPFFVGTNVYAPALLTGNGVIYKPSEHALLTGMNIANLLYKAGLPKDIFRVVIGGGEAAQSLLDQKIDGVFFTGSYKTGVKIAQQMAGKMVPIQLELGGKDPTYVCEDADVKKAAASLADGAFYNNGQSCCSVERIYVHKDVYQQFVDYFVEEVKGFVSGDPSDEKTYLGPLTLASAPSFLDAQVKDATFKGAKVLLGGKKGEQPHTFQPTVLVNVNHKMDVMREESFGPIIGIQEVKDDKEAIQLMNDCQYGLTAGVYTPSKERAEKLLTQIDSGTAYWNACDRVSPAVPWNGRKGSGIGSTLGTEGILAFTKPKSYHWVG